MYIYKDYMLTNKIVLQIHVHVCAFRNMLTKIILLCKILCTRNMYMFISISNYDNISINI